MSGRAGADPGDAPDTRAPDRRSVRELLDHVLPPPGPQRARVGSGFAVRGMA